MGLETNQHVRRLRRFQPFQPDSAELIFEQSDPKEKGFGTRALRYLESLVEDRTVKLIVLTGDAGHGKTSLCARLLERLGMDVDAAADAIKNRGTGTEPLSSTQSGRDLWILKDLSDVTVERAAALLVELLHLPDPAVSIVCANEGRLRSAIAVDAGGELRVVTRTLEKGIQDGSVSNVDDTVHVLNLNFQSVAPDGTPGLVDWALRTWAADRRSWQICSRCDARDVCPIVANHRQLSDESRGGQRTSALRELFSTAERAGAVVTTRQALAVASYAITGGLACADVHAKWRRGPEDTSWQHPHLYHQAVFADLLSKESRRQVPALGAIRALDPGFVAQRFVDDSLEPTLDETGFLPPTPAIDEGSPRSRRDAQRESEALRNLMSFLRRRDYFDTSSVSTWTARMGLAAGDAFEAATRSGAGSIRMRDELLRGLEAVQGIHRPGEPPDFLVLDPAFFAHRSRAAVVALKLPSRNVSVVSQLEQWIAAGQAAPELPAALDWISRLAYIRIKVEDEVLSIPLDLLRFELLHRWASGLSSRTQHEAQIRSLSNALARLAPSRSDADDITVLVGGERRTLTIDVGERVRSGDS
jgi:hypothetical protein